MSDLMKNLMNKKRDFISGLLAVLLTWGTYFFYIFPRIFFWKEGSIWAFSIDVWGDWGAHLTYASVFAYKPISAWLMHPVYYGNLFNYYFGADMISGLFIRAGLDYVSAFILPSLITIVFFLVMLYVFYYYFLKNPKYAYLAIIMFLTSGGLGFIWFVQDFVQKPELNTLLFPPREYTRLENHHVWFNIVTHELLPQRGMLLGIPLALVFILLLLHWRQKKFKVSYALLGITGFLSSMMLFVHVHSYVVFALFCMMLLILERNYWKKLLVFGISAAIPSIFVYFVFYSGNVGGFLQWYPGWFSNAKAQNINFFYFWILNWGLFLLIALLSIWKNKLYKNFIVLGAMIIFVLCNLFIFQPYDWDNAKLFTWVYLIFTIPVTLFLVQLWKKRFVWKIVAVVLFLVIIMSGSLDLVRLTNAESLSAQFLSKEEIEIAQEFRKISKPTDIVLTSDQHNHWVPTITGRQILMGYSGWLWSYGINYSERRKDILAMFSGNSEAKRLLKEYNVSYAVIGPSEKKDFSANQLFFEENYKQVLKRGEYEVYEINQSRSGGRFPNY